jgi:hypothetical protein
MNKEKTSVTSVELIGDENADTIRFSVAAQLLEQAKSAKGQEAENLNYISEKIQNGQLGAVNMTILKKLNSLQTAQKAPSIADIKPLAPEEVNALAEEILKGLPDISQLARQEKDKEQVGAYYKTQQATLAKEKFQNSAVFTNDLAKIIFETNSNYRDFSTTVKNFVVMVASKIVAENELEKKPNAKTLINGIVSHIADRAANEKWTDDYVSNEELAKKMSQNTKEALKIAA